MLAAGAIETGRAAGEGVLASLVRIVHDGTSQLVVAPAQCVVSMLVPLDMLLW